MTARTGFALLVVLATSLVACSGSGNDPDVLRIYTSVTQDTADAVIEQFSARYPEVEVELFRAPTGEVGARIAAELRGAGLEADILWLTDPLSIQQYARDGLLRVWRPEGVDQIPAEFRTETSFGTRLLNMVIIAGDDVDPQPADWGDLTSVIGGVALPDPAFAGSAFATLGFFALDPNYGMEYYRTLHDHGATEVQTPGDVVTGVAEGIYAAGVTLDRIARDAVEDGSPITLIWPSSGSITLYSPIAVVDGSTSNYAEDFVEYVISEDGQSTIATTGWQPALATVGWPDRGELRTIDWTAAFDRQDQLLADYQAVFGG